MLNVIFTLDYEIYGNGEGSPYELMVEPTDRILRLFNEYGAKLTIMADIAEIMRFKEYFEETSRDAFHFEEIVDQLKRALKSRHDVQLHLHPSYFKANYVNGIWEQCYAEYDLAQLGFPRLKGMIELGKVFLQNLLSCVNSDYRCIAFRTANWSMYPSADIVRALVENGIKIDTSVFKYGRHEGLVNFDYTSAYSDLLPWPVRETDICAADPAGRLVEIPIYSENRSIWTFLTISRIYQAIREFSHPLSKSALNDLAKSPSRESWSLTSLILGKAGLFFKKHSWKMDFNQCTGRQLIKGLKRAEEKIVSSKECLPVVLIGHSRMFTRRNERTLRPFLSFVAENKDRFFFGRFSDIDMNAIRERFYGRVPESRGEV